MSVSLSPILNGYQSFLPGGLPNNGGFIYCYAAGSTTPTATYTTSAGTTPNANPIPLSSDGRPPQEIWLTDGTAYKLVVTDSLAAPIAGATFDNISGVGPGVLLATFAASSGASLVGYIAPGSGAVATTVSQALGDMVSVFRFMTAAQIADVQAKTTTLDVTAAIQSAINAVGAQGKVYFPAGSYKVTSQLLVSNHRVHLVGSGSFATQIVFAPTASGTCLKLSASASVIYEGSVRGMSFYSSDSTYTKTAIEVSDTSGYLIDDIVIGGSVAVGGSSFWSGANSVGINLKGRELGKISRIYCYADRPIVISPNPNATISLDHFHFTDCILAANANPNIEVLTGCNLTQITFDGYQAWVLGTHGFYWNDTTSSAASSGLSFYNVRAEQGTSATANMFYLSHNTGLYQVSFKACYGGLERKGYYLRKCETIHLDTCYHIGSSNEAFNVDATVKRVKIENCFWQTGSTSSVAGQRIVSASPKNPNSGALPPNIEYDEAANTARNEIHDGVLSSTSASLTTGSLLGIGPSGMTAVIMIASSEGVVAIYALNGTNNTTAEISDPSGFFSVTSGTPTSNNIYWSAGNSRYELQNNRGLTARYVIVPLGSYTAV